MSQPPIAYSHVSNTGGKYCKHFARIGSQYPFTYSAAHLNQINIVAFVTYGPEPIGEAQLPAGEPWVKPTSQAELVEAYEGWGDQVKALLRCLHIPSKWSICVVHPHLSSYVQGRIALIGDAVRHSRPPLTYGLTLTKNMT